VFLDPQTSAQYYGVEVATRTTGRTAVASGEICPIATGFRAEVSGMLFGVGVDVNLDFLFFARSGEIGAFVTGAVQMPWSGSSEAPSGAGMGWAVTAGPLIAENVPNKDAYKGLSQSTGVMLSPGLGIEADVSIGQANDDGTRPTAYYLGVGGPAQAGYYGTIGTTYDLWDDIVLPIIGMFD